MKALFVIVLIFFQSNSAYTACTKFCTMEGERIGHYDLVWKELRSFYGRYMPKDIRVRYKNDEMGGYFDAERRILTVGPAPKSYFVPHEASHIVLAAMTRGKSDTEGYRFIDEGWASIIGSRFTGHKDTFKNESLAIAANEMKKGNLNFETIQNWTEYFGNWQTVKREGVKRNYDAYNVGASFVYYFIDTYGEKRYRDLLIAIGKEPDLNSALMKVCKRSEVDVQKGWQDYVSAGGGPR